MGQLPKALPAEELNSKCVNWQKERGAWTPCFMRSEQLALEGGQKWDVERGVYTKGHPQELEGSYLEGLSHLRE